MITCLLIMGCFRGCRKRGQRRIRFQRIFVSIQEVGGP